MSKIDINETVKAIQKKKLNEYLTGVDHPVFLTTREKTLIDNFLIWHNNQVNQILLQIEEQIKDVRRCRK